MILTSGKFYSIDMNLACTFGMCEAFILCQVDGWLSNYQSTPSKRAYYEKDHFKEGRWWTYDTVDTLTENLKYYSKSTIKRSLANLKDMGVIIIGHFGGNLDRTNWYSIDYDLLYSMVESKFPDVNETNRRKAGNQNEIMHEINMSQCDRFNMTPSSNILNNIYINKTNTSLIRGASASSLTFPEIPEEDQEKSKARVLELNDRINEVYPVKDGIATGLKAISDIVRYCTSYQELDTYLGGIWHGFNLKLIEYKNDKRNQDLEREQIDYRYFPKLENLINDNFTNPTVGYFADGIKKYRLQKMKEGDADAG